MAERVELIEQLNADVEVLAVAGILAERPGIRTLRSATNWLAVALERVWPMRRSGICSSDADQGSARPSLPNGRDT